MKGFQEKRNCLKGGINMKYRLLILLVLAVFAGNALCDWNPGEPYKMHWPQLPDLTPTGMDVVCGPYAEPDLGIWDIFLADDFKCSETGYITDLHIWCSYRTDEPFPNAGIPPFYSIVIYKDVPAGTGDVPYSRPGEVLWEYYGPAQIERVYAQVPDPGELIYEPVEGLIIGNDFLCYQLNFSFPEQEAFIQQEGEIYWVGLHYSYDLNGDGVVDMIDRTWLMNAYPWVFGWKTTDIEMRFQDDAVYTVIDTTQNPHVVPVDSTPGGTSTIWQDMHYPFGHPYETLSLDLAFVVTGVPLQPQELEYGDAPEGQGKKAYPWLGIDGNFPTCKDPSGYYIEHNNFGAYFGPTYDFELDGNAGLCPIAGCFPPYDQDECFQDGDAGLIMPEAFTIDNSGTAVITCPNSNGTALGQVCSQAVWGANIDIDVTNFMPSNVDGYVNVLADWNQDGMWSGSSPCPLSLAPEHVLVNFRVPNGFSGPLSVLSPPNFTIGPIPDYIWFRFSITEQPVPNDWDGSGVFEDGETEDYLLLVVDEPEEFDWGDAPDPAYPTLASSNGAYHLIVPGINMGPSIDPEMNGQPDPTATGDDLNGATPDDEDGVSFPNIVTGAVGSSFTVNCSVNGFIDAWLDFNNNGSWADPGEQIAASVPVVPGNNMINFPVPAGTVPGTTFARVRFSTYGGLAYFGPAQDGEVEDHTVVIEEAPPEEFPKWMQLPHGPDEGFDAASDLWISQPLEIVKWEQLPSSQTAGLHAHDYQNAGGPVEAIIVADDWLCEGGIVTDFHWWGYEEQPGAGLAGFHLSIHDELGNCLPFEPPLWQKNVPISAVTVTNTGLIGYTGKPVYRYDYYLPEADWFPQEQGRTYWFDVSALSVDPLNPYLWIWCEHNRSVMPILCPAASKNPPNNPNWQPILWTDERVSDMAFRVTSQEQQEGPNKVVADDFISDGRTIDAVRWWGSYLDERYMPDLSAEPYQIDGWIISFHHADPDRACPPDFLAGDDPTALALYFAPASAVEIIPMGYGDCFQEQVYEYKVNLAQCVLLCAEIDPRSNHIPGQPEFFEEEAKFRYWLDIQAVVGAVWAPDGTMRYTNNVPPAPGDPSIHFWGWHTSPDPFLEAACTGKVLDMSPVNPDCWEYGNWMKQPWLCPFIPPENRVDMSFELITYEQRPDCWWCATQCHADSNCDGIVNTSDWPDFRDGFGFCFPHPRYILHICADYNHDGCINTTDWPEFRDNFGTSPPADCP